jgi:UDP-N-acetylmuramoylalanine--D-glutamate ligase
VLLNITPDHLDRYGYRLENYVRSKFRIALNQRRGDVLIYNAASEPIRQFLAAGRPGRGRKIAVRGGFYRAGFIHIGRQYRFDLRRSALRGPHNMFNAVCALRVALLLGARPERLQEGLDTYMPPAHRLEVVGVRRGVTWINDSKATNVDSVFYALQSMEQPTVWIVGGQDKGNDYSPLLPLVQRRVKAIVCMGIDNSRIRAAFAGMQKPLAETRSAEEAVRAAAGFAGPGDTVLLSPACASFDLFKNYEHRGAQFREAVLNLDRS